MAGNKNKQTGNVTSARTSLLTMAFSWAAVSTVAAALLGFGISFMTSSHPYIADACCIAGTLFLLCKLWMWEELAHDTSRKTALVLAGGTILLMGVGIGLCALSNYVGRSANTTAQMNPDKQNVPPIAPIEITPNVAQSKPRQKPSALPAGVAPSVPKSTIAIRGGVQQHSEGSCSPNIIGNGNTNNCNTRTAYPEFTLQLQQQLAELIKPFAQRDFRIIIMAHGSSNETLAFGHRVADVFTTISPNTIVIEMQGSDIGMKAEGTAESRDIYAALQTFFKDRGIISEDIPYHIVLKRPIPSRSPLDSSDDFTLMIAEPKQAK